MSRLKRSRLTAAAITLGSVFCAVVMRFLIDSYVHEPIKYGMLYLAVVVTALHCGYQWGLLSVALSGAAIAFLLPPFGRPTVDAATDVDSLVLFLATAGLIVWMSERVRKHRHIAEEAARERHELLVREQAAREEAERLNRLKDRFLAAVSHELRTPLQSILGWAELLQASAVNPAEIPETAAAIKRSVSVQHQLINDLLDLSRIELGKLRLNVRPMSLREVLHAAVQTVLPAARAKSVTIKLEQTSMGPVLGDPDRLQQVAWNLLSNAIKFTPAGGTVEARVAQDERSVELSVIDSGEGIAAEVLPCVFDRFRQAEEGRRRGGLGLGLAIVKDLVELHGGRVEAHSAGKGRGATFRVSLPKHQPEAVLAPNGRRDQSAAADAPLAGKQVLVVDDDPGAREALRSVLGRYGAEVRTAESVDKATDVLQAFQPDVITCDLDMAGVDGFKFASEGYWRKHVNRPRAAIVALTGCASDADRERVLESGFDDHLVKPVHPRELAATLAGLSGRRRPR